MNISRAEITHFPKKRHLKLRDKLLDLSIPRIMGIINVTPDSFYENSRFQSEKELLFRAETILQQGADFIDIGSFSTRPGAKEITEKEELKRILPAIQTIRKQFPEAYLSVDTFRSSIARAALSEGADLINDIGGLQLDSKMIDVISEGNIPYILMHGAHSLKMMHQPYENDDLFRNMCHFFSNEIQQLADAGATEVILDPGFGFGKTLEQNFQVLDKLEMLHLLERPILMGISRKSMIYKKIGTTPEEALNGTTSLNTLGLLKGVSIFRVHDVKEMKEIIELLAH